MAGKRRSDRAYGGAASYPRTLRVNHLLQQVIAEELERLADADERLRFLTITGVEASADIKTALVLFASLSDDARAALDERRVALQRAIGSQATMKRTPVLSFEVDPVYTSAGAIEEKLRLLAESRDEHGATEEP